MRILKFNTKELAKELGCEPELLYSDVCIVDNEISNDLSILSWDYLKGKIICSGFLYQDKITIFLAEEDDEEAFKSELKEQLFNFGKHNPHAFNRHMENGNFEGFLDGLYEYLEERKASANYFYEPNNNFDYASEIKPFNSKGFNKDRFYSILIERKVIPSLNLKDKFNGDGGLCIPEWEKYKQTKDIQLILDIAQHNLNCLIKECVILKHKQYFLDNWITNERGWMDREKTDEEKNAKRVS